MDLFQVKDQEVIMAILRRISNKYVLEIFLVFPCDFFITVGRKVADLSAKQRLMMIMGMMSLMVLIFNFLYYSPTSNII